MPEGEPSHAVVLLSGGLDSSVALAQAMADGHRVHALTVDYGQRHNRELDSARSMATRMGVEHKLVRVDLSAFGGSSLTDGSAPIPNDRPAESMGGDIPSTYVPARNTVFLAMGLAWAEALDADAVYIGANAVDYSGYPDCRPEYIEAMQRVADLGTRRGVEGRPIRIEAPLLRMSKADIVRRGLELEVPFAHTWSCYKGRQRACGRCDSCQLRLAGFVRAGAVDPLQYEPGVERPDVAAAEGHPLPGEEPGKDGAGKDGAGKDGAGKDGAGKDGAGRNRSGNYGGGEDDPPEGSEERPIIAELVEEDAVEDGAGPMAGGGDAG